MTHKLYPKTQFLSFGGTSWSVAQTLDSPHGQIELILVTHCNCVTFWVHFCQTSWVKHLWTVTWLLEGGRKPHGGHFSLFSKIKRNESKVIAECWIFVYIKVGRISDKCANKNAWLQSSFQWLQLTIQINICCFRDVPATATVRPVSISDDLFFSIHSTLTSCVVILQCFFPPRRSGATCFLESE